ncbi:premelanosome protein a isoform X3 [Brienomyrus brachyistius]|uniref:premelanosome protein a isoform X3 n=1 Tax=Brienomyrus brachyistius TaxID=42636 RepID=UPI0020B2F3FB|nr:premelanosome protein a isoform X3 [Brienomyrus brachyistius]
MRTFLAAVALACILSSAAAKTKSSFTRYRSWNSRMYPVWKNGDSRYKDCWKGGEVTFDTKNDSPTISGGKVTFNIDIRFPQNQTVQPDGQVVWAQNCTINGTRYHQGQPVYPERNTTGNWSGVFPDGTPFTKVSEKRPRYVFVWKTWGRYWQVADGPSSFLMIGTDNIAQGSYNMEVVIYHCRGKDKFIPLGYSITRFSITDQIPFTVSLAQVNDLNQADQSFIQNRAIAFTVNLHDPSQYLKDSDVTFTWNFGDSSGTLISRELSVTHTYISSGFFQPQVVLQASIPNAGCSTPGDAPTPANPTAALVTSQPSAPLAEQTTTGDSTEPSTVPVIIASTADLTVNPPDLTQQADDIGLAVDVTEPVPLDDITLGASAQPAEVEASEGVAALPESAAVDPSLPAADDVTNLAAADINADAIPAAEDAQTASPAPAVEGATQAGAIDTIAIDDAASAAPVVGNLAVTVTPDEPANTAAPVAGDGITVNAEDAALEILQADGAEPAIPSASVPAVAAAASVTASTVSETSRLELEAAAEATAAAEVANGVEAAVETGTAVAPVPVVVAKRQAPEMPTDNSCVTYRYGSFAVNLDIIQGIESVEIVQVANVVTLSAIEQNAVDLTVTCQGSLPNEVCTVVSDADCITPMQTECSTVAPSPECQLILRQFFNDSGVFCINVSMTNDVSLAVTSTRVSVTVDPSPSSAGTLAMVLGVMILAFAVGAVAITYRRFKEYHPLREDTVESSGRISVPMLLWNLLSRQTSGESRPLLQGGVV